MRKSILFSMLTILLIAAAAVILIIIKAAALPSVHRGASPILVSGSGPQVPWYSVNQPTRTSQGTLYFVSTNGDNDNPGTKSQPWRTIKAAASRVSAGDTVIVLPGSYPERVHITHSGRADLPITFQAEGRVIADGFTVVGDYIAIKGFEVTNTPNDAIDGIGIYVKGSYCDLEDNNIYYATRGGILLDSGSGKSDQTVGCLVQNNLLSRNSQYGITVKGENHRVIGNEIWGTIQHHPNWPNPPNWIDADGIRFFGSGHIFRSNYIHDITKKDPLNSTDPHIDAFQTWDDSDGQAGKNCIFEKNRIVLGDDASGFQLEGGTSGLTIRNNIISVFLGVNAYGLSHAPYTHPSSLSIENNLFISSLDIQPSKGPGAITFADVDRASVKNNMFINMPAKAIVLIASSNQNLDIGSNLSFNQNGSVPEGSPYPNDLWGVDPRFIDWNRPDYHVQPDSPAIDSGAAIPGLTDDFDGRSRPQGLGIDIGPYEHGPN